MKKEEDAYEGEWDFDGSCAPTENGAYSGHGTYETFTLGCFQWVRRGKDGKGSGLKKGKVKYRVQGRTQAPAEAYQRAREFCARKNAANSQSPDEEPRSGDTVRAEDQSASLTHKNNLGTVELTDD